MALDDSVLFDRVDVLVFGGDFGGFRVDRP